MTPQPPARFERTRSLSRRAFRLLTDELANIQPAKLAAEVATAAMPHLCFIYLRTLAWRAAGLRIGERSRVMGKLHITGRVSWQDHLTIGGSTLITGPLSIDLEAPVHIGGRVRIGHDVLLLTVDHRIGNPEYRCGESVARPISIGDGSWIGSRVVVLPGVSIGKGSVVAAGAVVTRDVPANTLVAGVPAQVVRSLPEDAPDGERVDFDDPVPDSGLRQAQAKALTSLSPALRALS
ncbi:MAG TPA: acyltransferase [Polyangiaceae bacterium]|nr:acyltransferase [Polyangiaceae bacterium]